MEVIWLGCLPDKRSFMNDIMGALSLPIHLTKPRVIIADTIKGKGVSFMEGNKGWHGVAPKEEDLNKALKELEG